MINIVFPFMMVTQSCLLVFYYAGFFPPRHKVIADKLSLTAVGIIHLAFGYLPVFLRFHFDVILMGYANIAFIFAGVFVSWKLFKGGFKLHIFLICSFFAVQYGSSILAAGLPSILSRPLWSRINPYLWYLAYTEEINIEDVLRYAQILMTIDAWLLTLVHLGLLFIVLRHIISRFSAVIRSSDITEFLFIFLPFLLGLVFSFLMQSLIISTSGMLFNEIPILHLYIPLTGAIMLISLMASVKLIENTAKSNASEKERAVLQVQMQQMQGHDVEGIYAEIKGLRHDLKSHLSTIRLLTKSVRDGSDGARLEEYLVKFEDTVNKFDFAHQTGNIVSDVVIHQKYLEAKTSGIDFSADFIFPAHLNIDAYNLAVILNNGLENAIEACRKTTESSYIRLYAYVKGEMFFIELENSFVKGNIVLDKRTGLPRSTKSNDRLHGMGLSNIRRCAMAYLGDIDLQITQGDINNIFQLTIMLQSPA